MEAPERVAAPAATLATPLRVLLQAWTWPTLVGVTALAFPAACLASLLLGPERAFGHGLHLWARAVLLLGACTVELHGDVRGARGAVVAANHQGFGDVVVLAAVLPPPLRFTARSGLFRVPLLGTVLRAGGHLRVVRGGAGARALVDAAAREARAGRTVVFFPEGTRAPDGRVEPLHGGAFVAAARAGRPVVPLVLAGSRSLWEPGTLRLLPSRIAVALLPPRLARGRAAREALRDEMARTLRHLGS
ncbi:MAG TPA: lysophospholipid acyltransferase family protein [Candidatus Polarisedimenticolaceae bacterium]|nr:lysophospholipid acyltransferase family protein [Candidatus Polarisedimenticolaceae bacterium]